jgi:hypothetical protein
MSDISAGVVGVSVDGVGVQGSSTKSGDGVYGMSATGYGVHGHSTSNNGVHGEADSPQHSAVAGAHSAGGNGVYGQSTGYAGNFDGNLLVTGTSTLKGYLSAAAGALLEGGVLVTGSANVTGDLFVTGPAMMDGELTVSGNITSLGGNVTAKDVMLSGQDCAEDFELADAAAVAPGTVVVFDEKGLISESSQPYDRCVAGVISGAGTYRPGIVLGRNSSSAGARAPIALIGRVYCKVDASYSPIEVGDLLTTSATPGCAMKACDPKRAFGAVIGKALACVASGTGLIPVLVTLQ